MFIFFDAETLPQNAFTRLDKHGSRD